MQENVLGQQAPHIMVRVSKRIHEAYCDRASCDEHCQGNYKYETAHDVIALVRAEQSEDAVPANLPHAVAERLREVWGLDKDDTREVAHAVAHCMAKRNTPTFDPNSAEQANSLPCQHHYVAGATWCGQPEDAEIHTDIAGQPMYHPYYRAETSTVAPSFCSRCGGKDLDCYICGKRTKATFRSPGERIREVMADTALDCNCDEGSKCAACRLYDLAEELDGEAGKTLENCVCGACMDGRPHGTV